MTTKHMRRGSTSLVIMDCKSTSQSDSHFTLSRVTTKRERIRKLQWCEETGDRLTGRNAERFRHRRASPAVPPEAKHRRTTGPSSPTPRHASQVNKNRDSGCQCSLQHYPPQPRGGNDPRSTNMWTNKQNAAHARGEMFFQLKREIVTHATNGWALETRWSVEKSHT